VSSFTCARSPEAGAQTQAASTYTATGVVKSIDAAQKSVLIAHEDIPGYMKAMTMLFDLRDVEQVKGIAPGDRVSFTFVDDGRGHLTVESIRKL
jgi:protein SCO1/2